jgi:hypothetical protein
MTGRGGDLRFWSANSAGPLRGSCEKASAFWKQATCAGRSAASSGSENSPRACPTWARTRSTLVVSGSETCTPRYWRDCSAFGSERGCPPSLRQGTSKTASADHHLRSRHCRKLLPAPESFGRAGSGDRQHGRRSLPNPPSNIEGSPWHKADSPKIPGSQDRPGLMPA